MPPRMQKRKTMVELTTKHNNQLESRDCRVSPRRKLNPKSTMISDLRRTLRSSGRRLTLRSSKRPVETGTTSLSRCSQPRISRRHSAAPYHSQKLSVPAQTINTEYQVPEQGSHQIESPSRCQAADSVAHPFILEPELGHKEAENVENSTVGIQEMMEEEDEAENSLSNHSNLMFGQNTFEEEGIPMVEEIANKNDRKSATRAEYLSPSFSLKLTEMAAMAVMSEEEEDDEIDSERQSQPEDTVNGYQVQPEFMPTLRKIIGKHGDIAKSCLAKSVKWRSTLLETVCGIILELDKKKVTNIKGKDLKRMIDDVNEINNLKVEVAWLQTRLTEILQARQILKQSRTLKEKKDSISKFIEIGESELKECEAEKKELSEKLKIVCDKEADWKKRLARMHDESTKTFKRIKDAKSKVRQFLNGSLVDDLI